MKFSSLYILIEHTTRNSGGDIMKFICYQKITYHSKSIFGQIPDHFNMIFNREELKERTDTYVALSGELTMAESKHQFKSFQGNQYYKIDKPTFQHRDLL